jgi:hypothetical protein
MLNHKLPPKQEFLTSCGCAAGEAATMATSPLRDTQLRVPQKQPNWLIS